MTLDLRDHFSEFRGAQPGRIHLAAHSHHFWPDAACAAHRRALADAARLADNKWEMIFDDLIPRVQRGIAARLVLPDPATIAFAPNTHDFVRRLLSALLAALMNVDELLTLWRYRHALMVQRMIGVKIGTRRTICIRGAPRRLRSRLRQPSLFQFRRRRRIARRHHLRGRRRANSGGV